MILVKSMLSFNWASRQCSGTYPVVCLAPKGLYIWKYLWQKYFFLYYMHNNNVHIFNHTIVCEPFAKGLKYSWVYEFICKFSRCQKLRISQSIQFCDDLAEYDLTIYELITNTKTYKYISQIGRKHCKIQSSELNELWIYR